MRFAKTLSTRSAAFLQWSPRLTGREDAGPVRNAGVVLSIAGDRALGNAVDAELRTPVRTVGCSEICRILEPREAGVRGAELRSAVGGRLGAVGHSRSGHRATDLPSVATIVEARVLLDLFDLMEYQLT